MSGGLGFIDIIIFGVLAVFLIYRLGRVLGKRTGHEGQNPGLFESTNSAESGLEGTSEASAEDSEKVVALPHSQSEKDEEVSSPINPVLKQIEGAEPSFNEKTFLEGARAAFEMIISAFAQGDINTLQNLLSEEVFENFDSVIRDRSSQNKTHETTLIGIGEMEILEGEVRGNTILVTLKYKSQQVNVSRDKEGEVVDGDPIAVVSVTDIWTFSREANSSDPNWILVETRSSN